MKNKILLVILLGCMMLNFGCERESMTNVYNETSSATIIDQAEIDLNRDYIVDKVELFKDEGKIILKINKTELILENNYIGKDSDIYIKDEFELDEVSAVGKTLIGIARWNYVKENRQLRYLNVYEYEDGTINRIIDRRGIDYDLKISNISKHDMSYIYELHNLHEAYKKKLTQYQLDFIDEKFLENNEIDDIQYSKINASFHNTISNILYKDFNNDGNDDIIFISDTNVKNDCNNFIDDKVFFINLLARKKIIDTKFVSQSDIIKDSILGKYYLSNRLMKIREEMYTSKNGENKYRVDFYSKSDGKDNNLFDEFIIYKMDNTSANMIFNSSEIKNIYKNSGLFVSAVDFKNYIKIDDYDNDGADELSVPIIDMANYQYQLILDNIDGKWQDVFLGWVEEDIKYIDLDGDGLNELITDTLGGGGYANWWIGLKQVNVFDGSEYKYSRELTNQYLEETIVKAREVFFKEKTTKAFVDLVNAYAIMGKTEECKEMITYFSSMSRDKEVDFSPYFNGAFDTFYNFVLYRSELYKTQVWDN